MTFDILMHSFTIIRETDILANIVTNGSFLLTVIFIIVLINKLVTL